MNLNKILLKFVLGIIFINTNLVYSKTKFLKFNQPNQFKNGKKFNTFINQENQLTLSYKVKKILEINEDVVWSINRNNQNILISSTPNGKLSLYDKNYKLITNQEIKDEITSIAFHQKKYYLGGSQSGIIYFSDNQLKKVEKWIAIKINFIWDLKVFNNNLYVAGGGEKASIYKINLTTKKIEKLLEVNANNILKIDFNNSYLFFSTSSPGGFYQYHLKKKNIEILYENKKNEIPNFVIVENKIYLITSGNQDQDFPLRDMNPQGNPRQPENQKKTEKNISKLNNNFNKSQNNNLISKQNFKFFKFTNRLIEINQKKEVKTIFQFNNLNLANVIYDRPNNQLIINSFENGNIWIYKFSQKKIEKIFSQQDLNIAHFINIKNKGFFITANTSELYQIDFSFPYYGYYQSEIIDLKNTVHWGRIYYQSINGNDETVKILARVGNSKIPDEFWSDWVMVNRKAKLNRSRFIQLKIELFKKKTIPKITELKIYYSTLNAFINVKNFRIIPLYKNMETLDLRNKVKIENLKNIDSSRKGENFINGFPITPKDILLSWEVSNLDNHFIRYNLFYRSIQDKSHTWYLLKKDFFKPNQIINTKKFFDGKYLFKLIYDNYQSLGEIEGEKKEIVSAPFRIDNQKPIIDSIEDKKDSLIFTVKDNSIISGFKYSYDRKFFFDLTPLDKVFDEKLETFKLKKNKDLYIMIIDENKNVSYTIINNHKIRKQEYEK